MIEDNISTKFSFNAFRTLKKVLGEFDAVVECNEIAIKEFLEKLKESKDQDQFIADISSKHDINVNTLSLELFTSRIRQFYILSVMQQAEQFIDNFRKEYKGYNPEWDEKQNGETDFDNLLRNIFSTLSKGKDEIGKEIYDGFEYYRLIRNTFAHSEERDLKRLESHYGKIKIHTDFYTQMFHIEDSPNNYDNINFSDFILFTNIIKNIGYTLCEKCRPENSQIALKLSTVEIKIENKIVSPLKNINKLKNNPKRFSNAIGNLLNSNFGKFNGKDRDEIISHLKAF